MINHNQERNDVIPGRLLTPEESNDMSIGSLSFKDEVRRDQYASNFSMKPYCNRRVY